MERLLKQLLDLGARKTFLEAKLFGGACVIEALHRKGSHLGTKNVQTAHSFLEHEGIPVVAEDTGNRHGRKLIFHTDDGTAWVKRI